MTVGEVSGVCWEMSGFRRGEHRFFRFAVVDTFMLTKTTTWHDLNPSGGWWCNERDTVADLDHTAVVVTRFWEDKHGFSLWREPVLFTTTSEVVVRMRRREDVPDELDRTIDAVLRLGTAGPMIAANLKGGTVRG